MLKRLMEYQEKLANNRGNEINRNYWSRILAENFPTILKSQDEKAEVIEFMGEKYTRE